MKVKETVINNIYIKGALIVIILFASGYFIGRYLGGIMLKDLLLGKEGNPLLLYSTSGEFFSIYISLNSEDELKRLNGYYALADNNLIDEEFIIERFKMEKSPVVKRTIIWLLGKLDNNENVESFLANQYPVSSLEVKLEILRSLKRINLKRFDEFVKEMNIDKEEIEKLL